MPIAAEPLDSGPPVAGRRCRPWLWPLAAALLLVLSATLLGCGASGSAEGGANDNGARGHIKMGIPF